jgi:hypothetical protein
MSSTSRNFPAILLLLLVALEFGGGSLLTLLTRRIPGYLDNKFQSRSWTSPSWRSTTVLRSLPTAPS